MNVVATSAASLVGELRALANSRDLRPELAALRAHVYLRVGSVDIGCPPQWSEDIAGAAPDSELEIVAGCGHALLIEDRSATIAAIVSRLEPFGAEV
jgi:pimeloyl-ACP methyl ester carboxylesterase